MFLFIINTRPLLSLIIEFKYILCSYLSYLGRCRLVRRLQFKYILCSYLSQLDCTPFLTILIQIHLMFLFINIVNSRLSLPIPIQIHLMFLFILLKEILQMQLIMNSNTSYVLIYR